MRNLVAKSVTGESIPARRAPLEEWVTDFALQSRISLQMPQTGSNRRYTGWCWMLGHIGPALIEEEESP